MLYPVSLRCALPEDRDALLASPCGLGMAELDLLVAMQRYFVATHRGSIVAGAGWAPLATGSARVQGVFVADAFAGSGIGERLLWYAQTAALLAGHQPLPAPAPADTARTKAAALLSLPTGLLPQAAPA